MTFMNGMNHLALLREHLLLGNRKGLACGTKPRVCNCKQKQMQPSSNKH